MSVAEKFLEQLEKKVGKKLNIKINDNRSTMVSVRWDPKCTKVSLHRMFLEAPQNVTEELAFYIKKKKRDFSPVVKEFIQEGLKSLDYSDRINPKTVTVQGEVHNLEKLYKKVEKTYFKEPLHLKITWYREKSAQKRTSITLGQYHHLLRLVKVHRVLDTDQYPPYLIEFIIYHEMLHHTCLPFVDDKGNSVVHTKEFKTKEKEFKYYDEVEKWMKKNQELLFEVK